MNIIELKVPLIGDPTSSVILIKWLKAKGSFVIEGEPICEFESDKVSIEVLAEKSGILIWLTEEGKELPVGSIFGKIDTNVIEDLSKPSNKAYAIAKKMMYDNDAFSQWLGIEILELDAGKAILKMTVREEMTQGFGIAHGGISYSLADSALAFASNSHGRKAVSVETSISHLLPVLKGDILIAEAIEENLGNKIAVYNIRITNQDSKLVAIFKGTVYRTFKEWA